MKPYFLFVLFMFSSALFTQAVAGNVPAGPEHFSCGEYEIKGVLSLSGTPGIYSFTLYPGTTRNYTVSLKGNGLKLILIKHGDKNKKRGVALKVRVTKAGEGPLMEAKYIDMGNLLSGPLLYEDVVTKISDGECL